MGYSDLLCFVQLLELELEFIQSHIKRKMEINFFPIDEDIHGFSLTKRYMWATWPHVTLPLPTTPIPSSRFRKLETPFHNLTFNVVAFPSI